MKILVVHPLVAAQLEAMGMLTFLNSGGTVNYASNGIGVTDTQIGYMAGLRVVVDSQVPLSLQIAAPLVMPWAMSATWQHLALFAPVLSSL